MELITISQDDILDAPLLEVVTSFEKIPFIKISGSSCSGHISRGNSFLADKPGHYTVSKGYFPFYLQDGENEKTQSFLEAIRKHCSDFKVNGFVASLNENQGINSIQLFPSNGKNNIYIKGEEKGEYKRTIEQFWRGIYRIALDFVPERSEKIIQYVQRRTIAILSENFQLI